MTDVVWCMHMCAVYDSVLRTFHAHSKLTLQGSLTEFFFVQHVDINTAPGAEDYAPGRRYCVTLYYEPVTYIVQYA